jgi:hypothetical protein
MSQESRILAGVILITYPTVILGGVSLVSMLLFDPAYSANSLRQDLWRAGHAHAGVLLAAALVVPRYVDETALPVGRKWLVRLAAPIAAIPLPLVFFRSVLRVEATQPNPPVYVGYAGAAVLAMWLATLGVGPARRMRS